MGYALALTALVFCTTSSLPTSISASPSSPSTLPLARSPPLTLSYEDVVIAGGSDGGQSKTVEVLNEGFLRDLPEEVQGNSLSLVDNIFYSCGGYSSTGVSSECYYLASSNIGNSWVNYVSLPVPMANHSALVVDDHIWIIFNNSLFDLDTTTGFIKDFSLPFEVDSGHCTTSDDTKRYILGVGPNKDEIWTNGDEHDSTLWDKINTMPGGRRYFGCLAWKGTLLISGGEGTESSSLALDTKTQLLQQTNDLRSSRMGHSTFVWQGKPAIVGGYNSQGDTFLSSVETFDSDNLNWLPEEVQLSTARANFGLAQQFQ